VDASTDEMYGWLSPGGALIDFGFTMHHEEAANLLGSSARLMAEDGFARVVIDSARTIVRADGRAERHGDARGPRLVYVMTGTPLTGAQQSSLREVLEGSSRITEVRLEAQGPDMDDDVLVSVAVGDRVSLGRAMRDVNRALDAVSS
jgi:hypothetical protein